MKTIISITNKLNDGSIQSYSTKYELFGDGEYIVSFLEVANIVYIDLTYEMKFILHHHAVDPYKPIDFTDKYIPRWKLWLMSLFKRKEIVTQYEISTFDKDSLILSVLLTVLGIVGFIIGFLVVTLIY